MEYRTYHNCLRIQITPDIWQDERIEALCAHCVKYGFDNVMLMLNLEEFHRGHISLTEAREWVAVLKKAKKRLEENGIVVSVNNWIEMGHADRGRHLAPDQHFTTMVDRYGTASTVIPCPLCQNWRAYFAEYVTLLVRELQPDTYWIEDDFRLMNHAPLRDAGCFCPLHMADYNKRLGTNYTREEFVEKLLTPGPCNREREAWLDSNRDTMLDLLREIVHTVKAACPTTDVAIMTSGPEQHALEARDWQGFFDAMGEGGHKIQRIHLPYEEVPGKYYVHYFNKCSMGIRALCEEEVHIMPEVEHSSSSRHRRSPRFMRFALEAAIPLVLSGMTYSLYGFEANGPRDSMGYGAVVKEEQTFMQAIEDLHLHYHALAGVIIPIDPRACYHQERQGKNILDMIPREYHAAGYLGDMGVSFCYSQEKEFFGKTVFMNAWSMANFTDAELRSLFANNFVLVDGSGALALQKRGMADLICACRVENKGRDNGYHTYEECADKTLYIDGVRGLRASCRTAAGDFVEITYAPGAPVSVKTEVYGYRMQRLADAITVGKNFAVIPYILVDDGSTPLLTQQCTLRRHFLHELLEAAHGPLALSQEEGVCPYLYAENDKYVLILTNANVDTFAEISLRLPHVTFTEVARLGRDGKATPVSFTREGDLVTLQTEIEYLSSTVLLLS